MEKEVEQIKEETAEEVAVFGSVLIFMIGVIVRTILQSGYSQNQNYKAFRMALTTSFKYSEGLISGTSEDGNASRNSASVVVVEDRLTTSSAKYASMDRTPLIAGGSATHSRNLYLPTDYGEVESLPVIDYFINGIHFPFTTAGFKTVVASTNPSDCSSPYTTVPNHPDLGYDPTCNSCFDLDRNGTVDVTDPALRQQFAWQWQHVDPSAIDVKEGNNTAVDVDCDMQEETVIDKDGNTLYLIDYQEGDLDMTLDDRSTKPKNGLTNQDAQIYTYAKNPAGGLGTGTYLRIEEGKLYATDGITRQFVRSVQQKDSLDVIQRTVQMNKNTGHFCRGTTPTTAADPVWGWDWQSQPNPVEVCSNNRAGCFGPNTDKTCMVVGENPPILYVRSRIADRHGRKWVTDVSSDPYVNFNVPR